VPEKGEKGATVMVTDKTLVEQTERPPRCREEKSWNGGENRSKGTLGVGRGKEKRPE